MIGRLTGRVIGEEVTGAVILDVGGVGYELLCPVGTIGRAKAAEGGKANELVLHVHTNLRQDCIELFGFSALEERAAFRQLVSVPGVGPRLAVAVLNVLPASQLAEVIESEDRARMVKVPGVGKKTAERLVLELKGKLVPSAGSPAGRSTTAGSSPDGMAGRLVQALTGLGYRPPEAERAAKAMALAGKQEKHLSQLLREALDFLAP